MNTLLILFMLPGTYFCIDISYLMWHKIEVKMFSKHTLFLLIPVDQLWTKLANLRSYYTKELKKENDSKKVEQALMMCIKCSWSHFKTLDAFLRTQVVPRKSITNMVIIQMNIKLHSTAKVLVLVHQC